MCIEECSCITIIIDTDEKPVNKGKESITTIANDNKFYKEDLIKVLMDIYKNGLKGNYISSNDWLMYVKKIERLGK